MSLPPLDLPALRTHLEAVRDGIPAGGSHHRKIVRDRATNALEYLDQIAKEEALPAAAAESVPVV